MIRVRGLEKRYGDTHALAGVSFEIEAGEVVGFLGPNGAGKSTTLRCLAGLLYPDTGKVEVAGRAVDPDVPASREAIGYLPETTPVDRRMRVGDYLDFVGAMRGLARPRRREAIARVLGECDLRGWERRRISQLSKGYRQRVGLAQALLGDPAVLLLDEPTSGLDPAEVGRIRALIRRLGETKTVLLSTHVLSEVQASADRVLILAAGRLVADGAPWELCGREDTELICTVVGSEADPPRVQALLEGLAGVVGVRRLEGEPEGVRFALRVGDRHAVAARVFRAVADAGWTLVELEHRVPSLERLFLEAVEAGAGGGR